MRFTENRFRRNQLLACRSLGVLIAQGKYGVFPAQSSFSPFAKSQKNPIIHFGYVNSYIGKRPIGLLPENEEAGVPPPIYC